MAATLYPEGAVAARQVRCGPRRHGRAAAGIVIGLLLHLVADGALAAGPSLTAKWSVLGTGSPEKPGELALTVTVERGWHLNAHDPDRPYLIPTVLEIDAPAGAKTDDIRYPEAVVRSLAFAPGMPLRLYEGSFTIVVRVAGSQPERFEARLAYQACNEEKCLPPASLAVPFDRSAAGAKPAGVP